MNRNEAIDRIRKALKIRSGKPWSVTGGRGTAWGWITIDAPPARKTWTRVPTGRMRANGLPEYTAIPIPPDCRHSGETSPLDRALLAGLLRIEPNQIAGGVHIPASSDYYQEFVDRAEGRQPAKLGQPYWD